MKLLFSLARIGVLLLFSAATFAQSDDDNLDSASVQFADALDKVFSTKVYMDLDTTVFSTKQGNFYLAEADNAMIMTMVVPQSFAKAEEDFDKETKKDGYKMLEKKKFVHNGKNIAYQKGMMKKKGKKLVMYLYAIEQSKEQTIFFTGMHMDGDEGKFFPLIERAALSAKLEK